MAAKEKKSRTRKQDVDDVEVEVVPELRTREVVEELSRVESRLADLDGMTEAALLKDIKNYAEHAKRHAQSAVQSGASALVYAWACGKLLIAAKLRLGRGDFGSWREKNLGNGIMSERTSQRYMKLAKDWENIEALLEWSPTLRQAYIACGVLPEPPEREDEPGDDPEAAKRQALLLSITGIQKKLRLFEGVKGRLGKAEKTQLLLAKVEIDAFFDRILS